MHNLLLCYSTKSKRSSLDAWVPIQTEFMNLCRSYNLRANCYNKTEFSNRKPPKNKRIWSDEHINKLKAADIGFFSTVKTSGPVALGFHSSIKTSPLSFNLYIKQDIMHDLTRFKTDVKLFSQVTEQKREVFLRVFSSPF